VWLTKKYSDGSFGVADNLPCGENSHQFKEMLINALGRFEENQRQILETMGLIQKKGTFMTHEHEEEDDEQENVPKPKKSYSTQQRLASKYGKHSWKPFGEVKAVPSITTGSYKLDASIGDPNGWPEGSVIEVYGWQGAGKTLLTYLAIAEAQKKYPDRPCAIIDAEKQFVFQAKWAKKFGVKVEELYVSPCVTAEEAFDKCVSAIIGEAEYDDTKEGKGKIVRVIKPGNFSVIVVDSVSQLTSSTEFNASMDESTRIGAQAAAIGKGLRKLLSAMQLVDSKTIVFFINQIRMTPGVMFGNPESRPGGNALKFYATLIARVTKLSKSVVRDSKGKIVSHDVQVKFEKNKAGELVEKPVQFTLKYDGSGVDNDKELFDFALNNKMIDGAAGWYYFIDKKGIKIEEYGKFRKNDNGKDVTLMDVLQDHPDKKDELLKLLQVGNIFDEELSTEEYKEAYKEVKDIIENEKEVKRDLKKKNSDFADEEEVDEKPKPVDEEEEIEVDVDVEKQKSSKKKEVVVEEKPKRGGKKGA
jgi:recombination protein RecA